METGKSKETSRYYEAQGYKSARGYSTEQIDVACYYEYIFMF